MESWPSTMTRPDPAILGTVTSTTRDTLTGITYAPLTITAGTLKGKGEASGTGESGSGSASGTGAAAAESGSSSASGAGASATSGSGADRVGLTVSGAVVALAVGAVMAL